MGVVARLSGRSGRQRGQRALAVLGAAAARLAGLGEQLQARDLLLAEAARSGRVLVVDETRRSGGVSEGVIAALADGGFTGRIARVAAADSYVPLGDAASLVLVSEPEIEAAARRLLPS